MATDALVIGSRGGHRWTEGNPASRPHRHRHQPHQVEQHRKLFIGSFGAVEWLNRHQAAQYLLGRQQAVQEGGLGLCVGIEEDQHLPDAGLNPVCRAQVLPHHPSGNGGGTNTLTPARLAMAPVRSVE